MSKKFNSTISVVGVTEPKVQQALLKLLENSIWIKDHYDRKVNDLRNENQQLRQLIYSRTN